jgi:hypothetical protein
MHFSFETCCQVQSCNSYSLSTRDENAADELNSNSLASVGDLDVPNTIDNVNTLAES